MKRSSRLWPACRVGRLDAASMLPGMATPLSLQTAAQAAHADIIPGFQLAGEALTPTAFPPPRIPKDYQPRHEFADDLLLGASRQQHCCPCWLRVLKHCLPSFWRRMLHGTPTSSFALQRDDCGRTWRSHIHIS